MKTIRTLLSISLVLSSLHAAPNTQENPKLGEEEAFLLTKKSYQSWFSTLQDLTQHILTDQTSLLSANQKKEGILPKNTTIELEITQTDPSGLPTQAKTLQSVPLVNNKLLPKNTLLNTATKLHADGPLFNEGVLPDGTTFHTIALLRTPTKTQPKHLAQVLVSTSIPEFSLNPKTRKIDSTLTTLFKAAGVQDPQNHYNQILEKGIETPTKKLKDIPLTKLEKKFQKELEQKIITSPEEKQNSLLRARQRFTQLRSHWRNTAQSLAILSKYHQPDATLHTILQTQKIYVRQLQQLLQALQEQNHHAKTSP